MSALPNYIKNEIRAVKKGKACLDYFGFRYWSFGLPILRAGPRFRYSDLAFRCEPWQGEQVRSLED